MSFFTVVNKQGEVLSPTHLSIYLFIESIKNMSENKYEAINFNHITANHVE